MPFFINTTHMPCLSKVCPDSSLVFMSKYSSLLYVRKLLRLFRSYRLCHSSSNWLFIFTMIAHKLIKNETTNITYQGTRYTIIYENNIREILSIYFLYFLSILLSMQPSTVLLNIADKAAQKVWL